jgi:uncharacterized LabA/DUF88 family protein
MDIRIEMDYLRSGYEIRIQILRYLCSSLFFITCPYISIEERRHQMTEQNTRLNLKNNSKLSEIKPVLHQLNGNSKDFIKKNNKRVYLAVDAANLFCNSERGCRLNYSSLLELAQDFGPQVDSAIYVPRNHGSERNLLIALKFMGFKRVVARTLRQRPDGQSKSDLDVSLVMDLWEAALRKKIDLVVLCSGDSDLVPLVERLVEIGIEVLVVGPDNATAWELIVAATRFIHVSEVAGLIEDQLQGKHNNCQTQQPQI